MRQINFVGTFPTDHSGYGNHTRGLVNAFYDLYNKEFKIGWECGRPQNWEVLVSGEEKLMLDNTNNGVQVMVTMPHIMPLKASDHPKRLLQYCVFEGDKIPKFWAEHLNDERVSRVLVPSKHVFDACTNTGVLKDKLRIVPHGINTRIFNQEIKNTVPKHDKFTFLFCGGWAQGNRDRKDLPLLLKAFCEDFSPQEPVRLLVKINNAYQHPQFDYGAAIHQFVPASHAELVINSETVKTETMPLLYAQADVFCCISKGEAFGLTFLEALGCGLPCISGKWGGTNDFLNDDNSWLITPDRFEQATDNNLLYEGVKWAEYCVNDVRKALRTAFANRDEVIRKSANASQCAQNFSWMHSAEILKQVIDEVDKE